MWDAHVREFTKDANGAHTPSAADHAEAAAAEIVANLEQHAEALARQAHVEFKSRQDGADWYERICSYALLEQETDELYDGPDWVNWNAVANQATHTMATGKCIRHCALLRTYRGALSRR